MPITYEIDHPRKTVFAKVTGVLTPQELFSYQQEVWSTPALKSYHEYVDMLAVTEIESATDKNMQTLAELSVQSDDPSQQTRLSVIAQEGLHFGLGRMYETCRSMQPKNAREVSVFRNQEEALHWLHGQ